MRMSASRSAGTNRKSVLLSVVPDARTLPVFTFFFHTVKFFHLRYLAKKGMRRIWWKRLYSRSHWSSGVKSESTPTKCVMPEHESVK